METKEENDNQMLVFDAFLDPIRDELHEKFSKKHITISGVGTYLKGTLSALRESGCITHEPIWNAALFLNTVCYDLSIIIVGMLDDRDDWKRRFWARSLVLVLFEIGEDIPSVFGKRFREAATSLSICDHQLNGVSKESKRLTTLWNENRTNFKEIRVIAAAHRDHDALTLHETIMTIDLPKLFDLGLKFGSILNSLGRATQTVMTATANVAPPELSKTS